MEFSFKVSTKTTILLILLLLLIFKFKFAYSGNVKCNHVHSDTFENYKNNYDVLSLKYTYRGSFNDKCMDLGEDYRERYIDVLMANNIKCIGKWCNNNTYSCENTNPECYQVEHIVDRKNTPYKNCNTNILGNVIMAYGLWNRQMGQLCWNNTYVEKKIIYGEYIVCQAIKNVIDCSNCNVQIPKECNKYMFDNTVNLIIL